MKSLYVLSIAIASCIVFAFAASVQAVDDSTNPPSLMLADFEEPNVLDRLTANDGVTIALTDKDVVSGKYALEVRVKPFSTHKNQWPYVVFDSKYFAASVDLSSYSRLSATVRNVTEGLASVRIEYATLPYSDGGRNMEGDSFLVPGGTTWVCNYPTRMFELNDCSSITLIYLIFPANEVNAVYRIDAIQAIYDSAEGSPGQKLKAETALLGERLSVLKQKVKWDAIPKESIEEWKTKFSGLETAADNLTKAAAEAGTPTFKGKYKAAKEQLADISRQMGAFMFADKKDFAVWSIDPYINILKNETPDLKSTPLEKIEIRMAGNEFRDTVFMVSPCERDIALDVRVESTTLPAGAVWIGQTEYLKNRLGQETGDPVYPFSGTLVIPKNESRQIRLRLGARYSGIKPGTYEFKVILKDSKSGAIKNIPGVVVVWPFELPNYSDVITNNSYAEFVSSVFSEEPLLTKAVQDMKMFGMNVVCIHPVEMPVPTEVDADGKILKYNDSAFENRVKSVIAAWNATPGSEKLKFHISISGMYDLKLNRADIKFPEAKWKNVFTQWLKHFKETMSKLQVADKDWVMALGDEASEAALINNEIPMAEVIKSIDPSIRLVQNTSTVTSDPDVTRRFYKVFDVLQPHFPEFKSNRYLNDWIRKAGKTTWTYKCLCDMGVRGKNVYEYYRVYAWDVFRNGLTGLGVWTYCAQGASQKDVGCQMVFRHDDELVHSRRYDILREGLDDYRYIYALKAEAKKKGSESQQAADKLIQEAINDITADVTDTSRCEKWRLRIADEIMKLKS